MHAENMAESALTQLQRAVLELFFDLPESDGFVLAGGAALVATGLTERPTKDVDLFASDLTTGIATAADALEAACRNRGWATDGCGTARPSGASSSEVSTTSCSSTSLSTRHPSER
jgi:hypothetical protein